MNSICLSFWPKTTNAEYSSLVSENSVFFYKISVVHIGDRGGEFSLKSRMFRVRYAERKVKTFGNEKLLRGPHLADCRLASMPIAAGKDLVHKLWGRLNAPEISWTSRQASRRIKRG